MTKLVTPEATVSLIAFISASKWHKVPAVTDLLLNKCRWEKVFEAIELECSCTPQLFTYFISLGSSHSTIPEISPPNEETLNFAGSLETVEFAHQNDWGYCTSVLKFLYNCWALVSIIFARINCSSLNFAINCETFLNHAYIRQVLCTSTSP